MRPLNRQSVTALVYGFLLFISFYTVTAKAALITSVTNYASPAVITSQPQSVMPLEFPFGTVTQISAPPLTRSQQLTLGSFGFDPSLGKLNSVTIDAKLRLNNMLAFNSSVSGIKYAQYTSTYDADMFILGRSVEDTMIRRSQFIDCATDLLNCNNSAIEVGYQVAEEAVRKLIEDSLSLPFTEPFTDFIDSTAFGVRSFNASTIFTDAATLAAFSDPTTLLTMQMRINNLRLQGVKDCERLSTLLERTHCFANPELVYGQLIMLDEDSSVKVTFDYTPAVVPTPAAIWLFGSGLLVLMGFPKSKKSYS